MRIRFGMGLQLAVFLTLTLARFSLAAEPPVRFLEPAEGFVSDGSFRGVVRISKGFYDQVLSTATAEASVTITVEGTPPLVFEYRASNSGTVDPIALNPNGKSVTGYYWTIDADLSRAQCQDTSRTNHHCDGCGRSFTTSESNSDCRDLAVSVHLRATNRAGNSVCISDLDGDGVPDCGRLTGLLESNTTTLPDLHLPGKFWVLEPTGGMKCIARASSGVKNGPCKPIPR